jgi:hypothetical protein
MNVQELSVDGKPIPSKEYYNYRFNMEQKGKRKNTVLSILGIEHVKYGLQMLATKQPNACTRAV